MERSPVVHAGSRYDHETFFSERGGVRRGPLALRGKAYGAAAAVKRRPSYAIWPPRPAKPLGGISYDPVKR